MNAIERELEVARSFASCRGDEDRLDEAVAEIAELRAEVRRLKDENKTFRNAQNACEYCGPNQPRWEDGEPANLEAASEDAVEWLLFFLDAARRLGILSVERARNLDRCRSALIRFARAPRA